MKIIKQFAFFPCMLFIAFLSLLPIRGQAQSADFKALQSLDIYHSILRELSLFYVDSIQIDKLVETSINAMLEDLDPYTVYMPEEESEDFSILTTGRYGGVGSLIKKVPEGIEISEPYQGFPIDRAGLVAGDIILSIDGESTAGMDATVASKKMKGIVGTTVKFKILKLRTRETIDIELVREQIHISDITYSGMMQDGVGYIHLGSFTINGSRDFRNAFLALKKTGELKKLIIDLRSNGGGPVEDAVNVVGCFVPRGTVVVSARGRTKGFDVTYKTKEEPLDIDIPIAVLVNNSSASSSEIVAGALQDLDRAVVLGTRTFGKGLVQTSRSLGYNAQLKITTMRYYTPSGRCVQAIDYSHRNEDGSVGYVPDSLIKEFHTKNGRKVYDGGGITPDVSMESASYSKIAYNILIRDLFRDYSVLYYAEHESIPEPEEFILSDEDYEAFIHFMTDKRFDDKTNSELLLEHLIVAMKEEQLDETAAIEITALQQKVNHDRESKLRQYKDEFKPLIENEIANRYYYQAGRLRSILRRDKLLDKSIEVLNNTEEYHKLLEV